MKRAIFNWLERTRYPHIFFFPSPFKIYEYGLMEKMGELEPHHVILDVGCGHGLQTRLLSLNVAKAIGVDVSSNAIGRAKANQQIGREPERCDFRATTIEQAGFAPNTFDRIFSVCVLEHIPDDDSVLRECHRVMKPGGKLVFSIDSLGTITDQALKELHSTRFHVCRYYEPETIRAKLAAAGFTDIVVTPVLKSGPAKFWFEWGIRNDFAFRYSGAIWRYWILHLFESFSAGDKGLYLMIEARKASSAG